MAGRDHHPRRQAAASPSKPGPGIGDQEAVDGILVQVKKNDLPIADEQPGQVQKLLGHEVCVAIPEWDKNRDLLDPARKVPLAQQRLLARLQDDGISRPSMIERFNEIDKASETIRNIVSNPARVAYRRTHCLAHRECRAPKVSNFTVDGI